MTHSTRFLPLVALLLMTAPAAAEDARFIVVYEDSLRGRAAAWSGGPRVRLELPELNAVAVEMTPEEALALADEPGIAYVEPDPPRYLQAQSVPFGIDLVGASSVAAGPDPITVCVIDAGYDLGHPDLPKGVAVDGFGSDWSEDPCGHGTHVAGTIAALDNRRGVVGAIPGVSLHVERVFDSCDSPANTSDVIAAAFRCQEAGAKVINMSLGCPGRDCRSDAEAAAFDQLYDAGVLSVAAAGNEGNRQQTFPASYDSVISVAALDSAKGHASFSQRNRKVELAAPGVGVLSTLPRSTGYSVLLKLGRTTFDAIPMQGSPSRTGRGSLVDCGLGDAPCPGGGGQLCLIERGEIFFAAKVLACEAGGGRGAIIYNNVSGTINGTLGETETSIPSVGITRADGLALLDRLGGRATLKVKAGGDYGHSDGTSMAAPHVAGIAALIWSHNAAWTPDDIREALRAGAEDLGAPGRDQKFGFGLARAAQSLSVLVPGSQGASSSDYFASAEVRPEHHDR